ncbi:MAG: acyl-homoserine-lactone synthase [Henriciella sp.]|nr:acyl-homoserine-lactone synthase [Henriciella sp.]
MIEIVTPENRAYCQDLLEASYRMRYRVIIEDLGWNVPGVQPGRDFDQFDTEDTVYFLALSETGEDVHGCFRFNPTTKPHMLTDVFPEFCNERDVPRGDRILEASRFILDRKACGSKRAWIWARQSLGLAATEYCLNHGIEAMTWLTHYQFFSRICETYDSEPLGLPRIRYYDNETYIAALSKIDEKTWRRQRADFIGGDQHVAIERVPLVYSAKAA